MRRGTPERLRPRCFNQRRITSRTPHPLPQVEASIISNVKLGEIMFAKNKENGTKIRKIYGATLEAMQDERNGQLDPQVRAGMMVSIVVMVGRGHFERNT